MEHAVSEETLVAVLRRLGLRTRLVFRSPCG